MCASFLKIVIDGTAVGLNHFFDGGVSAGANSETSPKVGFNRIAS
jgi:hypothetical protein